MILRLALGVLVCQVAKKLGEAWVFISSFGMLMVFSVALARAVYARTKYVLLDDPLSAVVSLTICMFIFCPCTHIANRIVILPGSCTKDFSVDH
jgi:hypothetical protein